MAIKAIQAGQFYKEILCVLDERKGDADGLSTTFFFIKDKLHEKGIECTEEELVGVINSLIINRRVRLEYLVFEGKQVDVAIRYPAEKVAAS